MLSDKFLKDLDFNLSHGTPSFYQGLWRIVPVEGEPDRYDIYPDYALGPDHKVLPYHEVYRIAGDIPGKLVGLICVAPDLFRALERLTRVDLYERLSGESYPVYISPESVQEDLDIALIALGKVLGVYPD